jgi:hypothetical protein
MLTDSFIDMETGNALPAHSLALPAARSRPTYWQIDDHQGNRA